MSGLPLSGRCVVTTRDTSGPLDAALRELGAEVVHVPLIEIEPDHDALARALDRGDDELPDWVVVTSRHGAAALAAQPGLPVRIAAVGRSTAAVLERAWRRPVDLVPEVQHAVGLVEAFAALGADATGWRILVAQADRAEATLVDGLRELGHEVEVVTVYRTRTLVPAPALTDLALAADAITFASGSAALAWSEAVGTRTPPVVCVIGPSTARVARAHGLVVTHIAEEHSVEGLVRAVRAALAP